MSVPKSVVKVKKGGVEYTSNVDAAQYYIFELNRAALRDVAKFVKKTFKESFYTYFEKHSGDAGRATSSVVLSNKDTKYPRVEIGLKKSQLKGVYGYEQVCLCLVGYLCPASKFHEGVLVAGIHHLDAWVVLFYEVSQCQCYLKVDVLFLGNAANGTNIPASVPRVDDYGICQRLDTEQEY